MSEEAILESITADTPQLPEGDYAIVEMLGHRTIIGRMAEVERFGTKFLALEAIFNGGLLPAIMIGGASVYCLTPCSADVAARKAPKHLYQLPPGLGATVPSHMLPAPEPEWPSFSRDTDPGEEDYPL